MKAVTIVTMKKRFIIIPLVVAATSIGAVFASHYIIVRAWSSKYNLTTLEEGELPPIQEAIKDDFVQLSEVKMHYVQYGEAEQSVILVHGNRGSSNSLKELATYLANDYSVYCIDSRCHGLSSDPDVLSYDLMAKDVYEFINAKGLKNPYFVGHSDGGIIGIILSANYPNAIKANIACGANSKPKGLKNNYLAKCKANKNNKYYKLMLDEPNLTKEYLSTIKTPTYIVAGEYDVIRLSDTIYLHKNIPDSRIAIIKNNGHSTYMSKNGKLIYHLAHDYFTELDSK